MLIQKNIFICMRRGFRWNRADYCRPYKTRALWVSIPELTRAAILIKTISFSMPLPEDLIKYGLIPELVGRLPILAPLHSLNSEALKKYFN